MTDQQQQEKQEQERRKVLNSATLIMGRTHSGKSSLLATAAEYVWETYHKVSMLYLSDGGGLPLQVQSLVNLGIIWIWRMRSRSAEGLSHETCQRAAAGYWPHQINPETGETPDDVELVAPYTTAISVFCPQNHLVKVVALDAQLRQGMSCPTCKTIVNTTNMRTERSVTPTPGFEVVGARFYDGLTSMLTWGINDLTDRVGRQELTGEKSALGGIVSSGTMNFAGSNRAQVGFMQNRAETLVLTSSGIRGMVIPPIWTSLVQDGNDESGLRISGPQIIGQARTAEAPQWFGDALEATIITTNEKKRYRRLNLKSYIDVEGTRHLCGVRSYPGLLPDYLEDEDTGVIGAEAFVNFNMGTFYRLRENARLQTEAQYAARYPDAPGLHQGMRTFGAVAVNPTPAPPTPKPMPAVAAAKPLPKPTAPKPLAAKPAASPAPPPPTAAPHPAAAEGISSVAETAGAVPGEPAGPNQGGPATAPPTAAPAVSPSPMVTGPVAAAPPAPKPPARGPSAPPPGRRPTPAPVPVARPTAAPPAK